MTLCLMLLSLQISVCLFALFTEPAKDPRFEEKLPYRS
jgi:hypothetical protein